MISVAQSGHTPRPWGRWSARAAAWSYLIALLLLPLGTIVLDGLRGGLAPFVALASSAVARHALWLTIWTGSVMALINAVMGTLTALVLVRYRFPGRGLLNALIDLPFAVPSLVTGVMLVVLYGPQAVLGAWLKAHGWSILFAPSGIILALLFSAFPFVVRAVQPVLLGLDGTQEAAAATLGASGWQIFWHLTVPAIGPALISGTLLSFARALGEFGAVVVVAGNLPLRSQTAAVYVFGEVESGNQSAASAMSVVMLALALAVMLVVQHLNRHQLARTSM